MTDINKKNVNLAQKVQNLEKICSKSLIVVNNPMFLFGITWTEVLACTGKSLYHHLSMGSPVLGCYCTINFNKSPKLSWEPECVFYPVPQPPRLLSSLHRPPFIWWGFSSLNVGVVGYLKDKNKILSWLKYKN